MCQCACHPIVYIDPNQVELDYGMDMRSEKYHAGYMTGLLWDANWMPGGPWIYEGQKLPKLREDSRRENAEWQAGFLAGLNKTLTLDPTFAVWWKEFSPIRDYKRYPITGEFSLRHVEY